jgi:thiol reductant ABC exporter CydC subunit
LEYHSADLLNRVVSDIETLQDFYVRVLAPPFVAAFVGLSMWLVLGAFNWLIACAFLACYLAAGVGVPFVAYWLAHHTGQQIVEVRAELKIHTVDSIQGMADLLAFGAEEIQTHRLLHLNQKLLNLQRHQAWVNGLQTGLSNLLMNLATWTMLVLAIPLVGQGKLDGIYLAVLALATLASFETVLPLPLAFQQLSSSLQAAQRLFAIIDAEPTVSDTAEVSPQPLDYSVSFEQVSFRYQPAEPLILQNLNLQIPSGKCVAVLGESGAGKTSLANLLLRFWNCEAGQVKLGGFDVGQYCSADLHQLISVVSQDVHLFNASIRENLLIARPNASEAELFAATTQAQIHDFILSLPQGYATLIGEQGLNLSGGERQRLAIARALLKAAPILVLDEPTANLDNTTERQVMQAIQTLQKGRTTLLITHRLTGLEIADCVVVLEGGSILLRKLKLTNSQPYQQAN